MNCARVLVVVIAAAVACSNDAARAPTPTSFRWPERFDYRLDYVSDIQRGSAVLLHYAESKTTKFAIKDQQYLGAQDSVLKTSQRPNERVALEPYGPEDTLGFYVSLGRRGEITNVQLACDPALRACAAALPSAIALELRRFIPRLPVFEAPLGATWQDTLEFDDSARPGGLKGAIMTRYTGRGDTLVGGVRYWLLTWRSARSAAPAGARLPEPVREEGFTLVEKARSIPVFATWASVAVAPPELAASGATSTASRGRAYLAGSVFDSIYGAQLAPKTTPAR